MAQRVIITAAAGGIGRAIAERFRRDGHAVHICDIDAGAVAATITALGVTGSVTDVGDPRQVEAMFAEAMTHLGGVDVLINNHGIAGPRGFLEDLDYEEWDHCLRVNLSGMFYTMKQAVPHMKKQRSGCILNLATTSARTMLPKRAAYVAGKVGVMGLTKNCAREFGPWNIRVNCVNPGTADTPWVARLLDNSVDPQAERAALSARQPHGRLVTAAEIDELVRDGLGLRWSVVGPFETFDLNTRGGIAVHAERMLPAYRRMGEERGETIPAWTPETIATVVAERRAALPLEQWNARVSWRDRQMMALVSHRARRKPD